MEARERHAHARRARRHQAHGDDARRPARTAGGRLFLAALLLVTFAAYQPAWHGGPLWDDDGHLTRSDMQSVDGLRRIWVEPGATQQYYPLLHSTFWLLHRLWGDHTLGYHLLNIALHALSALLFWRILGRLAVPWPWFAALVFALHPVHVESVAWITELKNTLSGALFLGSALAYLRFDRDRRRLTFGVALALFILALMSKTVTATLPALLLVVLWWQRGRLAWRRDVLPMAPLFAAAGVFGSLTVWAERSLIGARGAAFEFTVVERMLIAGRAVWFYLGKLAWPSDLTFIYPKWQISAGDWRQYLYPVCVIVLLAALWLWRGRSRAPLAAMLFFCIALSPALGFLNVYPFRYSFVADHFQYLASLGVIAFFSGMVATALARSKAKGRWTPAAVTAVVVVPLAVLTWSQSRDYTDAETLYRATIARDPSCWMAHNNLAVLKLAGPVDEAMAHLTEALQSNPAYPEAHNNMGLALQLKGRFEEAVAEHSAALRLEPGFAEAHNNRGTALQKLGRPAEAAAEYREALRLRPGNLQGYVNLGNALLEMGQLEEAVRQFQEALRIDPTLASVHYNLGAARERMGRTEEAIAGYREALRLEPESADAHARLGALLEAGGRLELALTHYEASARLQPDSARAYLDLGNALYRAGAFERAAAAYETAVGLAPESAEARNNLGAALERLGRTDEAAAQYQEALRLLPGSPGARANLTRTKKRGRD